MFSAKLSHRILASAVAKRWKTVFVGLSGGIDSSISAYLLLKQGYDVKGVFMKNWSVEEETDKPLCPLKDDFIDARNVAEFLGIPLLTYDFEKEYWTNVFEVCLEAFSSGLTPNPDVLCNRYIKFDAFARRCFREGADYIATGHYCRTNQSKPLSPFSEGVELLRGVDKSKDQSYFLSQIDHSLLSRVLFPVGGKTKTAVRRLAEEIGLPNARKEESMGICFIGERNMKTFLNEYLSASPGIIRTIDGREIGKHDGILFYTIGQGVKMPNQREKYYVCQKNTQTNELIVCPGSHPALFRHDFYIDRKDAVWMSASTLPLLASYCSKHADSFPIQCQLRYQTTAYPCRIEELNESHIHIQSCEAMRAVTSGQACVFYDHDVCLGGSAILSRLCEQQTPH